jgi:patatin-like phospholipase/acyl hydrolase
MRILSIDGGGFLGLAVGTLLQNIEDYFHATCHNRFDLFCGTSTGAIIALGLASGLPAREIVTLYESLGARVFASSSRISRRLRYARSFFAAKYSNTELRRALIASFGDGTFGDLRRSGKRAVIPAFCVTNGRPRIFNTGSEPFDTMFDDYLVADIALASSAAPSYFPMVRLARPNGAAADEVFCDGGVVANHPALIGFAEALSRLQTPPGEISLLSISTPRLDLSEPLAATRSLSRGLIRWAPVLSSALPDSASNIMHQALLRIIAGFPPPRPRYVRVELENRNGIPMDLASQNAVIMLRQIGIEKANEAALRADLKQFFVD